MDENRIGKEVVDAAIAVHRELGPVWLALALALPAPAAPLVLTTADGLLGTDLQETMYGLNPGVYLRFPFLMGESPDLLLLTLRMKYDDGFVAFLNGTEIARDFAPATPAWNSTSTGSRRDSESRQFVDFDVTAFAGALVPGLNILAIHGLNDSVASSDLLIAPQLVAVGDLGMLSAATLVDPGTPARALVPTGPVDAPGWTAPGFDDHDWQSGTLGLGYDLTPDYGALIGLDVEPAMSGVNGSAYLRVEFPAASPQLLESLTLRMKYDDGFVAWLNGTEIARDRAPDTLDWNSLAAGSRRDSQSIEFVDFDVSSSRGLLVPGTNVLAIHGLNDLPGSSDFLILPVLTSGLPASAAIADPYLSWALTHGLDMQEAGYDQDPEGDGLDNLGEFGQGGIPTLADAATLAPFATAAAGPAPDEPELRFTYRRRLDPAASGLHYEVQSSTTLDAWQPAAVTELHTTPAADGLTEWVTVRLDLQEQPASLFVRLAISRG